MKELTEGIHVKKDLGLASEFAELIPDEAFDTEDSFVNEHIETFMKYIRNSFGAAINDLKIYHYQKLLNHDTEDQN